MKAVRSVTGAVVIAALLLTIALAIYALGKSRPQDLPWTDLDLSQPVGLFTGRKLAALSDDFPACRAALNRAGVRYTALPPRREDAQCGYADAVRFVPGGSRTIRFAPRDLGVACPVAGALGVWEWEAV